MITRRTPIRDTKGSRNLQIRVERAISVDEMEAVLLAAAEHLGLAVSHTTTLGAVRYPGNRHWHFKQDLRAKGCLDVTYWPGGPLMWVTMRNLEPAWVHDLGKRLAPAVQDRLAA